MAAYAALSALWIVLSDRLVSWLFPEPALLAWAQTLKGGFFVVVTTLLLYIVLPGAGSTPAARRSGMPTAVPLTWPARPST